MTTRAAMPMGPDRNNFSGTRGEQRSEAIYRSPVPLQRRFQGWKRSRQRRICGLQQLELRSGNPLELTKIQTQHPIGKGAQTSEPLAQKNRGTAPVAALEVQP